MTTVVVSAGYEIAIPQELRKKFGLQPGQRMQVVGHGREILLRPILRPDQLIGILRDARPIAFEREPDRELP